MREQKKELRDSDRGHAPGALFTQCKTWDGPHKARAEWGTEWRSGERT